MKFRLPRYREALVLFALLLPSFGFAETLTEFTSRCETELQIPQNSITGFDCSTGGLLPTSAFGNACDAQALLGGVGCAANSRLGLQTYSNENVKGVWVCRKYAGRNNPDDQQYYDIAMIVHNRQNGKTCFFQNQLDNVYDGPVVPSPKAANASSVWSTPQVTASINCTTCHSNDAFIVTPHVAPAMRFRNMIRFNPKGAYSVVGQDFAHFNSQISRTEGCGGLCHFTAGGDFAADAVNKQWMLPGALPNYTAYHFNPVSGQFYSLGSNGEIRGFNGLGGGTCNGSSCPQWSLLDSNPSTTSITAADLRLYQLHSSGQIYRFKGVQCSTSGSCPSWELLDNNSRTVQIVSGYVSLYQRWNSGEIWRFTGSPCSGSNCTGWQMLDNNPATVEIVAAGTSLYQRHSSGAVFRHTGTACSGTSCPGWQQIANDSRTTRLIADNSSLYMQQQSGAIWKYTGTPCNASGCPGRQLVDGDNPNTKQVVAGGSNLYRLYNNGEIWRYSGSGQTWTLLDNNPNTREIVASNNGLLQRHSNGLVWRFTGTACTNGACSGWTPIENFSNTVSLTGARQ
jgi:hypothetical protein